MPDGEAIAIVRPEAISLAGATDDSADGPLVGTVIATAFLGAVSRITVDLGGGLTAMAQLPTSEAAAPTRPARGPGSRCGRTPSW